MLRFISFFLCVLWLNLPAFGQSGEAPTVVMVFRHAETGTAMGQAPDPSLTEAGRARAQSLLDVVGDAGVTAIYSSQFKRTQETVAPLAAHLAIPVTTVEVTGTTLDTYPKQLADRILADHPGETVVVVNHSNTVPLIVEALGSVPVPEITEDAFDHFLIVIIPASGPARTIRARY